MSAVPPVSPGEATEIGRRHYGIDAAATRLEAEIDDTFRLVTADGTARLLKISAAGPGPAGLATAGDGPAGHGAAGDDHAGRGGAAAGHDGVSFQTAVLLYLASAAPGLPVQRVIPALDGRPEITLATRAPDGSREVPRLTRMTSWLDGRLLAAVDSSQALRRDIGATLARLNIVLREFRHPGARRTHRWDLQNFGALRTLLDGIPEAVPLPETSQAPAGGPPALAGQPPAGGLRAALTQSLDRFDAEVRPRLAALPVQVIHTDFHGENLLTDGTRITGILDFGDALTGPVAMDVGVAACYQLGTGPAEADPLQPALDVVAGYHAVDPLRPQDLPLIGEFILFRLAARIIVSQWNAARNPANRGYLLRRTPQAARHFTALRAAGPEAIQDRLRTALEGAA